MQVIAEGTATNDPWLFRRPVVEIQGALGSSLRAFSNRLVVRRGCPASGSTDAPRDLPPMFYADVDCAGLGKIGALTIVEVHLAGQAAPLPVLALERDQLNGAIEGLVAIRRMMNAFRAERHVAPPIALDEVFGAPEAVAL